MYQNFNNYILYNINCQYNLSITLRCPIQCKKKNELVHHFSTKIFEFYFWPRVTSRASSQERTYRERGCTRQNGKRTWWRAGAESCPPWCRAAASRWGWGLESTGRWRRWWSAWWPGCGGGSWWCLRTKGGPTTAGNADEQQTKSRSRYSWIEHK